MLMMSVSLNFWRTRKSTAEQIRKSEKTLSRYQMQEMPCNKLPKLLRSEETGKTPQNAMPEEQTAKAETPKETNPASRATKKRTPIAPRPKRTQRKRTRYQSRTPIPVPEVLLTSKKKKFSRVTNGQLLGSTCRTRQRICYELSEMRKIRFDNPQTKCNELSMP